MRLVIVLLALIAALISHLVVEAWDLVTGEKFHWVMLGIVFVFVSLGIFRESQILIV
jgi:hypothetical protein